MKKIIAALLIISVGFSQEEQKKKDQNKFIFIPDSITLKVGEEAKVKISLVDSKGNPVNQVFSIRGQRKALDVSVRVSDSTGVAETTIKAYGPGDLKLRAYARLKKGRIMGTMKVNVPLPPLEKITFIDPVKNVFVGTSVNYVAEVYDKAKLLRENLDITFTSNRKKIAEFDRFGNLTIKKPGKIKITVSVENLKESVVVSVNANPVKKLNLTTPSSEIRTGDVIQLTTELLDKNNKMLKNIPINYSYSGKANFSTKNYVNNQSSESVGLPASGLITKEGKFVAETPGVYTLTAQSSGFSATQQVKVVPRNVGKRLELVGHGTVSNVATCELWVWPGIGKHKGKDFAVTGTHSADGEAYFWDVSDPANMKIIDTVKVDARTVNDVKISENGKVGIITREGASNRKNGLVILDVSDPYNVSITKMYNENLTGGVHNAFIYKDHVYALSAGTRYDVIDISDPKKPFTVGSYELDTPGHSIHDVWIEDGIAYSSNWADGVHVVDVGGLKQNEKSRSKKQFNPFLAAAGQGSPGNPVKLSSKSDINAHNHAAFPFQSKSTNKFYIISGDEWAKRIPGAFDSIYQGGFHFLDFTDIKNPKETAIYQVPEVGSHNHWIEGDVLYAGYYYGGMRVVDISGELLGDLYAQGREIALFQSQDPNGFKPNESNVWGVIPYKGLIYFTDMYNGLWAVKLVDKEPMGTN